MNLELIEAVKSKNINDVIRLLAEGYDLEQVDPKGMTALLHSCEVQSFDILKLLVDAGAKVNHANAMGLVAVDIAYWYGEVRMTTYTPESTKMVKYLQANGGKSAYT